MAARNFEQELDEIKVDIGALKGDIKGLVSAIDKSAREQIKATANKAKKYGKKGADAAEHQITEHPFASMGVAFGLGLVLGRLLNGR